MKKIISAILTVALLALSVFTLAACKPDNDGVPTLTVAFSPDFAPMEFVDASQTGDDKYVGFDILLIYYIAKELGMKVELKPMSLYALENSEPDDVIILAGKGHEKYEIDKNGRHDFDEAEAVRKAWTEYEGNTRKPKNKS